MKSASRFSLTEWALIFTVGVAIFLAVNGVLWYLWTTVLQYFWAAGPQEIIDPPFVMFLAAVCLLGWLSRLLGIKK